MAEYITKEQALETQCEKCPVYNCVLKCSSYTATKNLPTADVVERSKIDKAIEEMESYEEEVYHRDTEKKEYACVYHCLEILKRNIGD